MKLKTSNKLLFCIVILTVILAVNYFAMFKLPLLITNHLLVSFLTLVIVVTSLEITFAVARTEVPLLFEDDQRYQHRHWTTAEINAGAINRLETQRKKHEINWLKYMLIKHWFYKLYIPKDKAQWGK